METSTLLTVRDAFVQQLLQSARGTKTSLPFIRHRLPSMSHVKQGERFQVLVIGGSVYKSAIVKATEMGIQILEQYEAPISIFESKEAFLSFIASLVDPEISELSINFAFPMTPELVDNRMEGILVGAGKEHSFQGLFGERLGQSIKEYLEAKGHRLNVSIVNDTICLLLSGLTEYPKETLAAGIVGTGLNFAIFLPNGEAINLESALFDKFPVSEAVKRIDAASRKPGKALFEKATSGAYLYQLFNEEIKLQKLDIPPLTSTEELSVLASHGTSDVPSRLAMKTEFDSAELVSCQIAGITELYGHDTAFVMEGSLFWKGYRYKETVEQTVSRLTSHGVSFIHIPDSGILGAAKLLS